MYFRKAFDSVRKEVFYITAIESDITMTLVGRLKMCMNEIYSRVWEGKNLSDMFPIRNGLKQGDAYFSSLL